MSETVLLGYEIPSGKAIEIPTNAHLCVTGQTQQSGKTTTLEALITRSGKRAVTFVTKRGEGSFANSHQVAPYFRHHGDWNFVRSILEASQRTKMNFQLPWLMRACQGAHNLEEVSRNLDHAQKNAKRSFDQDQYMVLKAYLDVVLPQIQKIRFAPTLQLREGINVMDVSAYSVELQALVIRSALEWVHDFEKGIIVVIPEAWEFLPQGRGSPVKRACEEIFRKGAALGNYVWLDSQDIAGVWKDALRACTVWILGVQREAHEVKRSLAAIPAVPKPKAAQVMQLERGQFYASFGKEMKLVYVCPSWMLTGTAYAVAIGKKPIILERPPQEDPMDLQLKQENDRLTKENQILLGKVNDLTSRLDQMTMTHESTPYTESAPVKAAVAEVNELREKMMTDSAYSLDYIWDDFRKRLMKDVGLLAHLKAFKPAITVAIERQTVEMGIEKPIGQLALLISEGRFEEPKKQEDLYPEFRRRGWMAQTGRPSPLNLPLAKLVEMGFLTIEPAGYQAVPGMIVNIVEAA